MRLSERKLLILTFVAIVLLVVGGGAWGYYRYTASEDLKVEIAKLEEMIAERGRKAKTISELKILFNSEAFKKEEEALDVHLPMASNTGDVDIWQMLNRMRKGAHPQIIIRRVEPVKQRRGAEVVKTPPGVRAMIYRADIVGSFYDVLEYMSELENADRIVRIEDFELKRRSQGGSENRMQILVDADVQIAAFEYEKAAVPAAVAPAPAP